MLIQWLGIPELASAHGAMIDHMLEVVHWFMLVLFVGWTAFFLFTLWRFRARNNPKANYRGMKSKFSTHAEVGVVVVEVLLLLGFAFPLWAKRVKEFPMDSNPIVVRATGYQFGWHMHYAGADGKFGQRDPQHITAANPIGLDPNHADGADDFVVNRLVLPVGQPAVVQLSSFDVIHNMAIPVMRIAQDAIPGSEIPMWFTPVKEGEWEIVCGQLCGLGHGVMKGIIEVMPVEDYNQWLQAQAPVPPVASVEQEVGVAIAQVD